MRTVLTAAPDIHGCPLFMCCWEVSGRLMPWSSGPKRLARVSLLFWPECPFIFSGAGRRNFLQFTPNKIFHILIHLGEPMATLGFVEYANASPAVRAVYDDIMATRKTDWINNFWKALAGDPVTLRRTWESVKQVMSPGALEAVVKEMIYLAVSATNQCGYCIASHTAAARKAGMSDAMFAEVMAVVGMANETNRLASGYQVEIDERFLTR